MKPGAAKVRALQETSERVGLANALLRMKVAGGGVVKLEKPVTIAQLNEALAVMGDKPIEGPADMKLWTVVVAREELSFSFQVAHDHTWSPS